jgi:hypothetical protein
MSKSNAFETLLLQHIFLNADIADIGDAAGLQNSATAGSLYISLHTADPGEGGTQSTSEASYTGYARVAVVRTSSGWSVTGDTATNVDEILFGTCTASGQTITHVGCGVSSSGRSSWKHASIRSWRNYVHGGLVR